MKVTITMIDIDPAEHDGQTLAVNVEFDPPMNLDEHALENEVHSSAAAAFCDFFNLLNDKGEGHVVATEYEGDGHA